MIQKGINDSNDSMISEQKRFKMKQPSETAAQTYLFRYVLLLLLVGIQTNNNNKSQS